MIQRLADQLEKESRDLDVLQAVLEHHPIGIVRLSKETGISEHKVRYSLRMLENGGYVEATQQGAVPAEDIEAAIEDINSGIDALSARLEALADADAEPPREDATAE
jgi:predicted transcriptional regulator